VAISALGGAIQATATVTDRANCSYHNWSGPPESRNNPSTAAKPGPPREVLTTTPRPASMRTPGRVIDNRVSIIYGRVELGAHMAAITRPCAKLCAYSYLYI
jgi:hypothetical protein